jgi:hypothetical protein
MSSLNSIRASVVPVLLLMITLAQSACSDSATAPNSDSQTVAVQDLGEPAQPDLEAGNGSLTTPRPAFAVVTNAWVTAPFRGQGFVSIPAPAASCASFGNISRSLGVSGIRVTNMDYLHNNVSSGFKQKVMVETFLWRRVDGTTNSWQLLDSRVWVSSELIYVSGQIWLTVPAASFTPASSGAYHVTVRVSWWLPPGVTPIAWSYYHLNSSDDYIAFMNSGVYGGYCTL